MSRDLSAPTPTDIAASPVGRWGPDTPVFERVRVDHPLWVLFSSGTKRLEVPV